jgi:hypothetical protein
VNAARKRFLKLSVFVVALGLIAIFFYDRFFSPTEDVDQRAQPVSSSPTFLPLPDREDQRHGWDLKADDRAYSTCLAGQRDLPPSGEGKHWRLEDSNRAGVIFDNERLRLSCEIRYRSPESIRMELGLIEGDAEKMQEERIDGVSDLLGHSGSEEHVTCFAHGGVTPTSAVDDATLLVDEGGMTANLQTRLKDLMQFEFANDETDEKLLQSVPLNQEESGFLSRAIETRPAATAANAQGNLAKALLLGDDSALIISAIYARHTCASREP